MRLIDADALPISYDGHTVSVWKVNLDEAKTIDAVPVIRCKDCKLKNVDDFCDEAMKLVNDDDFCSWAERK